MANLTKREAAIRLSTCLAQEINEGKVSPYKGAKENWRLTLAATEEEYPELDPFIYAASEYEDRPEDRLFFEKVVITEAVSLLNSRSLTATK
jgi:hypothetical protein